MKQWKRDGLLILVVLIASAVLWIRFRPGDAGAYAVVTQRGVEIARYPLNEDLTVTLGDEAYNVLTVSGGEAFVSDANCGDHTCIHTGRIGKEGEQIICLPHGLVIEIIGGEHNDIDASTH